MANYSLYARSAAVPRLGMVLGGQSKKRALRPALGGSLCLPGLKLRVKRCFRPILYGLALSAGLPTALFYLERLFLNLNFLTFNKA